MLIMTSHGDEQAAVAAMKAGALDYIVKSPEAFADMPHILARVLSHWQLLQERQQAEEELQRKEEHFRSLIENSSDAISIVNADGTNRYVSPSYGPVLGYVPGEEVGSSVFNRIHPDDITKASEDFARLLQDPGYTSHFEVRIRARDGSWRVMEGVGRNLLHHPAVEGIVVNFRDITERTQSERKIFEYEELNKLKSDLLSTVSHELRLPLAVIKGYSTMLLRYDRRLRHAEKLEYLESIDRVTDRMTELVERLLDMSRLEAGLLRLDTQSASISKLIEETVAEARIGAPEREITVDVEEGLPLVNIDPKRIRQVLDNLIDNATKYSEKGTTVMIEAQCVGSEVQISMADQGMGIPPEHREKVFERMYRVEQRLNPELKGAGLGLAICKGLVEAHGGQIWVESEVGQRSTFYFTLPVYTRQEGQNHGETS
jgi:PAS domain S-box-containing protein